jgi:Fe-S cluster biogenesis protein NfuA
MKKHVLSLAVSLAALALGACTTSNGSNGPESVDEVSLPDQEKITEPTGAGPAAPGARPTAPAEESAPTTERYRLPVWEREDVQPKSRRHGERYGLDAFSGRTIVVVLLEGHCPYCQSNSTVAQQLQDQLTAEKLDVQIVVLGDQNATEFASRVSLPIFEDRDGAAWETMRPDATKHDSFVFGPDGKRTFFWPGSYQGDATRWRAEVGAAVRAVARPIAP